MKSLLIVAVSILVFARGEAQPSTPSTSLTLRAAVNNALSNNPALKENREKVNQADTEIPVARSFILPNLSAVTTGNRQKDAVNGSPRFDGNPFNAYDASLKLNQVLFQVGALDAIHAAQKDVTISKLNAQISERDLTNNVIQAYYQIVLASRDIETLLTQEKIEKEAVDVAKHREKIGRGQLLDYLQAKTQLALLQGQLATARNQLQVAAANLAYLLGDTGQKQFQIPDKMDAPKIETVDSLVNLQDAVIPEIQRDEVSIMKIDDQKSTLWGQNLPYLSLVGNYSFASYKQSDLLNDDANSWGIGLQLTIPLFSGLSTIYQERSLDSQKAQLIFDKQSVQDQVSYQQVTNRKNLETALENIVTGTEAFKLALDSYKEARRNYTLATIDFVQFLSVQQAYAQAEQALNTYRYNYIAALGNYYAASGQNMQQLVDLLEKANP